MTIVPHPKVKKVKNPFYDKKFKIANQVDAAENLINACKFIICASPSTVIAYAIKNYKPILILEGEGFKNSEAAKLDNYLGIKVMTKFTGCSSINYEVPIKKKIFIKVNKKKYDNYRFQFLTSKKLIGLNNYQIISKIINQPNYTLNEIKKFYNFQNLNFLLFFFPLSFILGVVVVEIFTLIFLLFLVFNFNQRIFLIRKLLS